MTVIHHISEGPANFEDLAAYVADLHSLLKKDRIESVTSITWKQGEPIKAEISLKHPVEFLSGVFTIEQEI